MGKRKSATVQLLVLVIVGALGLMISATDIGAQSPWYEQAKKEGDVILYTSVSVDEHAFIVGPFSKKYPGVKVTIVRQSSNSVLQRLLTEHRAGKAVADMVIVGAEYLDVLQREGLLQSYHSSEGKTEKDSNWFGLYLSDHGIGYNSKVIAPNAAPTRYTDLLKDQWKNQIALNIGNPTWIYSMLDFFGNEKGMEFLKKFASTGPRAVRGTTNIMQSLTTGEVGMAVALNANTVVTTQGQGAPVMLAPIKDPVYADIHGIGIQNKSLHPNAARLFVDFMVSKEGQSIVARLSKIPLREDVSFSAYPVDRKNLRVIGPDARANIDLYEKIIAELYTK